MSKQTESAKAAAAAHDPRYQRQVAGRLDETVERIEDQAALTLDAATAKWVIFSDLHKGARNHADDFRHCEKAYNAALAWYLRMGYTLVVLGDVEELWKERVGPVISSYGRSLELEARFHRAGRYIRFWGNHDDLWGHPGAVKRLLGPIFGEDLQVREAAFVNVEEGGQALGRLFLLHGHQGTSDADPERIGWVARAFVRFVWRPIQRIFKVALNTPAKDFQLRHKHSVAMYRWAESQPQLALIAGHTHQPVFRSRSLEQQVQAELAGAQARLDANPGDAKLVDAVAVLEARLEWVRASREGKTGAAAPVSMDKPCYFNTGCCCFNDGDVTALEIADGSFRLVRWPDDKGDPHRHELATETVRAVFRGLGAVIEEKIQVPAIAP
ncbi:MAG: metallophosphoesterase [Longimicrobiaceae bacterium]